MHRLLAAGGDKAALDELRDATESSSSQPALSCSSSARLGSDRLGSDWLGSARIGSARIGSDRLGSARIGSDRIGSDRLGSTRIGSDRLGSARIGLLVIRAVAPRRFQYGRPPNLGGELHRKADFQLQEQWTDIQTKPTIRTQYMPRPS
jgi:hypothetical protein